MLYLFGEFIGEGGTESCVRLGRGCITTSRPVAGRISGRGCGTGASTAASVVNRPICALVGLRLSPRTRFIGWSGSEKYEEGISLASKRNSLYQPAQEFIRADDPDFFLEKIDSFGLHDLILEGNVDFPPEVLEIF